MKKVIRLTESDLHRIVEKSVNRILREANALDANFSSEEKEKARNERNNSYDTDDRRFVHDSKRFVRKWDSDGKYGSEKRRDGKVYNMQHQAPRNLGLPKGKSLRDKFSDSIQSSAENSKYWGEMGD